MPSGKGPVPNNMVRGTITIALPAWPMYTLLLHLCPTFCASPPAPVSNLLRVSSCALPYCPSFYTRLLFDIYSRQHKKTIDLTHQLVVFQAQVTSTLATLKTSGILAIIRAKNCDAAINRGLELIELGCRSIEVTLDTVRTNTVPLAISTAHCALLLLST